MGAVTPQPPEQEVPPVTEAPPDGGVCPRCSTPYEPYQEYCLECGLRLPLTRGVIPRLHAAWTRRLPWYPGDWLWPVLLALLIAGAATAFVVLYTGRDDGGIQTEVATTDNPVPLPTTAPPPPPTQSVPTGPVVTIAPTVPTAPPGSGPPPPPPPPPKPAGPRSWPAARNGYTIVIASLPTSAGRAGATRKAKDALAAGLSDVGVIDSKDFSSLHPGYFVVFAGIYGTLADAEAAMATVRSAGFAQAYPRQITH